MANTEAVKNSSKSAPATGNGAAKDRFQKVVTDRPMYRVEKCSKMPLVGHLLGLAAMPPAQITDAQRAQGQTGHWNAYVIKTTEPTLACTANDAPVEVPVGTEVIIGESAKLSELRKYLFADKILEIRIETTGKVNLQGGKTMRTYDIGADFDHPIPRPQQYALPAAGLPPMKQLSAGDVDSDEIPF